MKQKRIAIFGSTGSVGTSALEVVRKNSGKLLVYGLAVHSNIQKLADQVQEFTPQVVAIFDEEKAQEFQRLFPHIKVLSGLLGLEELAQLDDVDYALMAMSGNQGLTPLVKAIESRKQIGLANKEVLISAGEYIMRLAHQNEVQILPVDSEHSALFQCLIGEKTEAVQKLILTASGGPFREYSSEQLRAITPSEALKHPTWSMGPKITVDSSTLMNKGLELIEAHWLFGIPIDKIDVVIHPQSIIHSMVEFIDGSIKAQMSRTSMEMPIHFALFYPERATSNEKPFDFTQYPSLTFSKPDTIRFLCLKLAIQAIRVGKSLPCYMNAANEVLVQRFLNHEIAWHEIGEKLESLMSLHKAKNVVTLNDILSIDKQARYQAQTV